MYLAQQWEKSIDILSGYAEDRSGAFSKKKKKTKNSLRWMFGYC